MTAGRMSNIPTLAAAGNARASFELGLLLRQAHKQLSTAMDETLSQFGIERRHLVVLIVLSEEGPLPQRDLVNRSGYDKASMVRIVDDLERLGLVTREPMPGDRRLRAITVTAHGSELFRRAEQDAARTAQESLTQLTQHQKSQLGALLGQLLGG